MSNLNNNVENLHIGKFVKEQLRNNGQSIVWLTKQLGYDRSKIYRIFYNPDIFVSNLMKISVALKHNFFEDLSKQFEQIMDNQGEKYRS
ncbi:MAG: XRE family transcriptional regulator [Paludibacter sp.]|nr:XRE family transcriptional regulator [Paludibacter sp.]